MRWFLLALSLSLCLVGCGDEEPAAVVVDESYRIRTEVSSTESLSNEIITSASVETASWQPLYFASGGRVAKVYVKENDRVKRGALLASLDTDAQKLNVEKAELQLEQAQLNEEQAKHKLEQSEALIATGGASPENVYDKRQRHIEAQNSVKQAGLNLETQQVKLAGMQVRAPFSGAVNEVNIRVGDLVRGDVSDPDNDRNRRPPFLMVDPSSGMIVRAQLPEGRAAEIEVGIEVRAQLMEDRDVILNGKVTWVSSTVDRENRTVHVNVELEKPKDGFPPTVRDGATVLLTFLTDVRADAVTVSERALYYFRNQVYVFRLNSDKTVSKLEIEKGVMRAGRVEVVKGLPTGVTVARSHLYLLRDGQSVELADGGGE